MKDLNDLLNDKDVKIIDVRTEEEFIEGHIKDSINIPLHEISDRIDELRTMQPMILCCRSGQRSGRAVDFLRSHGIEDLCNGGGWLELVDLKP